jgi:hypothetical protein
MKTIYLLPWINEAFEVEGNITGRFSYMQTYVRKEIGTNRVYATLKQNIATGKWSYSIDGGSWGATSSPAWNAAHDRSFSEASEAADRYLTHTFTDLATLTYLIKEKFYLIKEDEIERFKKKLMILL